MGADDAAQALGLLGRFGSVTCLNGHVHQVMSKTEGNVTVRTCAPTAYPLPAPGKAPAPNPVVLPASRLHTTLAIRDISYTSRSQHFGLTDEQLP